MNRSHKKQFTPRRFNTEKTYTAGELIASAVGRSCSPEIVKENQEKKKTLQEYSEQLIDKAIQGSNGTINPYRANRGLSYLDTLTEENTTQQAFQNWNWIPTVSSLNRRRDLRNLAIFLQLNLETKQFEIINREGEICVIPGTHPGKRLQFRYAVLTGGSRIPLAMLESRIIYIQQLLQHVKRIIKKHFPAEFVYSGLEITLKRDSNGIVWAHPHLNILYCLHEKIDWSAFLAKWQSALNYRGQQNHWRDCGTIQNVNEVVKYVTKCDEIFVEDHDDCEDLLEEFPDEQRKNYGKLIGLCNLTPDEFWQYLKQTAGYRDSETGNTKRPKLINPSGSFRLFNSFINDPVNGVKIVAHENENTRTVEYVLQYKERRQTQNADVLTPGNDQPERENLIVNESGVHANASTYQQTTKLLILNYTETPVTEQGRKNLETIKKILATRQSQAIQNGATIIDQKTGREITAPFFYLPTPRVELPRETLIRFTISTIVQHAPVLSSYSSKPTSPRLRFIVPPALNEQRFIQLQANAPPPRTHEPHTFTLCQ